MKAQQISHVNEALMVLRHFINLSAKLLPFLDELQRKKSPTASENTDRLKIIDVYRSYNFYTRTSEMLLNSNVLELIKHSFENITSDQVVRRRHKSNRTLTSFLLEYKRLKENWGDVDAN